MAEQIIKTGAISGFTLYGENTTLPKILLAIENETRRVSPLHNFFKMEEINSKGQASLKRIEPICQESKESKALKYCFSSSNKVSKVSALCLFNEILIHKILRKYPHENILSAEDFINDKELYGILFEIHDCDLVCFFRTLKEHPDLIMSRKMVVNILLQIAKALEHLHSLGMVHCDLKPENVLINRNDQVVKLADFGYCQIFNGVNRNQIEINDIFKAPEQGSECILYPSIDIYPLGLMIYVFSTGRAPFIKENDIKLLDLKFKPGDNVILFDLARRCVEFEPLKRPAAKKIVTILEKILEESVGLPNGNIIKRF